MTVRPSNKTRNILTWQSAADAAVNNLRRRGDGAPTLMGYKPGTNEAATPITGDDKFAYFKDTPDITVVYQLFGLVYLGDGPAILPDPNLPYASDSPTPDIDAFAELPHLDVRHARALAVFIEYFPNSGMLELIAEGGIRPPGFRASGDPDRTIKWFPLGVLDSTLDPTPTTNLFLPGGAVRQVYSSELRWDGQALAIDQPIRDVVVFDVSWYTDVRLRVADVITEDSGLNVWAVMGR